MVNVVIMQNEIFSYLHFGKKQIQIAESTKSGGLKICFKDCFIKFGYQNSSLVVLPVKQ